MVLGSKTWVGVKEEEKESERERRRRKEGARENTVLLRAQWDRLYRLRGNEANSDSSGQTTWPSRASYAEVQTAPLALS